MFAERKRDVCREKERCLPREREMFAENFWFPGEREVAEIFSFADREVVGKFSLSAKPLYPRNLSIRETIGKSLLTIGLTTADREV